MTTALHGVLAGVLLGAAATLASARDVELDRAHSTATVTDASGALALRVEFAEGCRVASMRVMGREVLSSTLGAATEMALDTKSSSSRDSRARVEVQGDAHELVLTGIALGRDDFVALETWRFEAREHSIVWTIERRTSRAITVDECSTPSFVFAGDATWTAASTGFGGSAWFQLFAAPNATWGVHDSSALLWKDGERGALKLAAASSGGEALAMRYRRRSDGNLGLDFSVSATAREPQYALQRFQGDRADVWKPFALPSGTSTVALELSAVDYDALRERGELKGLDTRAVRRLCDTVARIGAVDDHEMGSNGFLNNILVLHEPWLADLGLAIDDANYDTAFARTLEHWREHALLADGRVKSRWCGHTGDEAPNTYDALGFYECQWGLLVDAQPDYVLNTADSFELTGDRAFLARQKTACERALEYLLRRDSDGDGLVEAPNDSLRLGKSSDWIDVVWASHENALVNAQMYAALERWSDDEVLLGDDAAAQHFRAAASKLKQRFNQDLASGGFWDGAHQGYAYWREKDGSVHGTNGVVPVDFSAIGYGLCDDPARRAAILERIESRMRREKLFFWPLCFDSFAPGEASEFQYPFPKYENGDLFLAWGELGLRCYAPNDPELAFGYVKNVLAKYASDGLAFQRYLRATQSGAGDDILSNNANTIVGLYRDLLGLIPKWNRLLVEPHLARELTGSRAVYDLRGVRYEVEYGASETVARASGLAVRASHAFALDVAGRVLRYFPPARAEPELTLEIGGSEPFELSLRDVLDAPPRRRAWSELAGAADVRVAHRLSALDPSTRYEVLRDHERVFSGASDATGELAFELRTASAARAEFELVAR